MSKFLRNWVYSSMVIFPTTGLNWDIKRSCIVSISGERGDSGRFSGYDTKTPEIIRSVFWGIFDEYFSAIFLRSSAMFSTPSVWESDRWESWMLESRTTPVEFPRSLLDFSGPYILSENCWRSNFDSWTNDWIWRSSDRFCSSRWTLSQGDETGVRTAPKTSEWGALGFRSKTELLENPSWSLRQTFVPPKREPAEWGNFSRLSENEDCAKPVLTEEWSCEGPRKQCACGTRVGIDNNGPKAVSGDLNACCSVMRSSDWFAINWLEVLFHSHSSYDRSSYS